jgi:hypothetical protein
VLSDSLVAAESARSERVECSQPLITVPAARICGRDITSRGNRSPVAFCSRRWRANSAAMPR